MTEKELLEKGYRKYSGTIIDIYFNLEICEHSGNCVRGNPDVFNTKRKPWIIADNASKEDVMKVIDTCPSGALKYIVKDSEEFLSFLAEERRFYLNDDQGQMIAEITYSIAGDKLLIIDHTFVDPSLRGKQIGNKLIELVVKLAIDQNRKVIPLCPFALQVFTKTEAYHHIWHR